MIDCGYMKVNVEVPADSDLDENDCDESDGELINSSDICITENVLVVCRRPSVYKHGARSGWLYFSVSDKQSGDYVNGANKNNIKYSLRVPLYFIQVCRLV
jgi:hypothetical protein